MENANFLWRSVFTRLLPHGLPLRTACATIETFDGLLSKSGRYRGVPDVKGRWTTGASARESSILLLAIDSINDTVLYSNTVHYL